MGKIVEVLMRKKDLISGITVSKEEISQAEQILNVRFAKDYVEYLKAFGFACYDGHELTGLCKAKRLNVVDVTLKEKTYINNLPVGAYVIEEAHIDDIVIWQVQDGGVYQSNGNHSFVKIFDNLCQYIEMK